MLNHSFLITSLVIASIFFLQVDTVKAHEHDGKCGTFNSEWKGEKVQNGRPANQFQISSPSGKFLIHYDNTGENAVPQDDKNLNNIPDWVDSVAYYFDYAYRLQIDTLGYPVPPTDAEGGSSQYDVYIHELGKQGIYGVTYKTENPITGKHYLRFRTYIVIDNDYSERDTRSDGGKTFATFGYDGLKCTIVHEYFHAIQLGCYGQTDFNSYYEMASTWMEWRAFPEIKDYIYQARRFFLNPSDVYFGRIEGEYGYKYGPFAIYTTLRYSDNLMRESMESILSGQAPYKALDLSLNKHGSSLRNTWCDFLPLAYRTGYRAQEQQFPTELPNAKEYPALKASKLEQYSEPSYTISNRIPSFNLFLARCILPQEGTNTPDTADFILTNPDTEAILNGSGSDRSMSFRVTSSETLSHKIDGTPFYWEYILDGLQTCNYSILTSGFITEGVEYCFPSPFRPDIDPKLYIPAPSNSRVGREISLSVYSLPNNTLVYNSTTTVSAVQFTDRGAQRVVVWENPPSDLASGVYLYTLRYFDTTSVGKFSVKR